MTNLCYFNCHGIVESSRDRGAIRLGREVGIGDVGDSGDEMSTRLPSFGSRKVAKPYVLL